jgi:hypothetical protein
VLSSKSTSRRREMLSKSVGVLVGLATGLFFFLGFWVLGQPFNLSLLFGVVGGFANGWIVTGWTSADESKPEESAPEQPAAKPQDAGKQLSGRELFKQWQKERYERRPSLFFWKNPRLTRPQKREMERRRRELEKQKAAGR